MENYILITYSTYLILSISLTIWVARSLFSNGKRFLLEIFQGDSELSESVNRLLVTGFYLINIGYVVITMTILEDVTNSRLVFEILSHKIGLILLVLGVMHFMNLLVLFRLRKKAQEAVKSNYDDVVQKTIYSPTK